MIKEGDAAPDFEARDAEGNMVKLSDLRGQKVVLYFYPKDDTPGCTKEACSFRDAHSVYEREGIKVLGVSLDDEESHQQFAAKFNLPFTLLADTDHKVAETYGVYGEKSYAGKTFSRKFTKPGTYPYHCAFHGGKGGEGMSGTVVVTR